MTRWCFLPFKVLSVLIAGTSAATLADAQTGETRATYWGNPARTASDGQAGPRAAAVLWAFKSLDHCMASPLPLGRSASLDISTPR